VTGDWQPMTATVIQVARVAAVIALLGVAAAIATPRGRLPLALRGLFKTLGRALPEPACGAVPTWKRLVALLLVVLAALVALALV